MTSTALGGMFLRAGLLVVLPCLAAPALPVESDVKREQASSAATASAKCPALRVQAYPFLYRTTADAVRSRAAARLRHASECMWQRWPTRDGAEVQELVRNLLQLMHASPRVFLDAAPDAATLDELLASIGLALRTTQEDEMRALDAFKRDLLKAIDHDILAVRSAGRDDLPGLRRMRDAVAAARVQLID